MARHTVDLPGGLARHVEAREVAGFRIVARSLTTGDLAVDGPSGVLSLTPRAVAAHGLAEAYQQAAHARAALRAERRAAPATGL